MKFKKPNYFVMLSSVMMIINLDWDGLSRLSKFKKDAVWLDAFPTDFGIDLPLSSAAVEEIAFICDVTADVSGGIGWEA